MKFGLKSKIKEKEIENYALKISIEFGKKFGQDIVPKLNAKFPNLSIDEINSYKELVKNVESDCWNSVDYKGPQIDINKLHEILEEKIFLKYYWINSNNRSRIKSIFSYYFWKDGILK